MNEQVSIDYLILSNHAEVVNGLLYLSGGGFTEIYRPAMEAVSYVNNFCAALSIFIPKEEVGVQHTFTLRVQHRETRQVLSEGVGSFSVGLLPTAPPDSELHVAVAVQFNIIFPAPGPYRVYATVDDRSDSEKEWKFRVQDVARGT
jgi:hypothetical protein